MECGFSILLLWLSKVASIMMVMLSIYGVSQRTPRKGRAWVTLQDHCNWISCLGSVKFSYITDVLLLSLLLILSNFFHILHSSGYSIFQIVVHLLSWTLVLSCSQKSNLGQFLILRSVFLILRVPFFNLLNWHWLIGSYRLQGRLLVLILRLSFFFSFT